MTNVPFEEACAKHLTMIPTTPKLSTKPAKKHELTKLRPHDRLKLFFFPPLFFHLFDNHVWNLTIYVYAQTLTFFLITHLSIYLSIYRAHSSHLYVYFTFSVTCYIT